MQLRPAAGHRLRRGRFSESGRCYLITAACFDHQPYFTGWRYGRCAVRALMRTVEKADTLCYVVMPDHLHWLLQLRDDAELSATVQMMKSLSKRLLRELDPSVDKLWQRGFHDRALRRDEDVTAVARYVVANPLRAGLVQSVREWPLWDAAWL